ncbi:hypothetical protein [Scytonema millei]|uniref:Uncharacterized protein n=1 Tax=Scytonema millei VB511283 TaxID=1245923 RepID=A0A9X5E3D6_9CYAN|nr:hypothetical protein [Scytonema millei]NHC34053.1 hypothetical protein [Scytonema millei VB511283]
MQLTESEVFDAIKSLSTDEKQAIQLLLKQDLREERRQQIYENFQSAQVEQQKSKLNFSANINKLRQLMEE